MMYGTLYPTVIPVVWALIAFSTAIVYLVMIISLFFFFLYVVASIILAVIKPIVRLMTYT